MEGGESTVRIFEHETAQSPGKTKRLTGVGLEGNFTCKDSIGKQLASVPKLDLQFLNISPQTCQRCQRDFPQKLQSLGFMSSRERQFQVLDVANKIARLTFIFASRLHDSSLHFTFHTRQFPATPPHV